MSELETLDRGYSPAMNPAREVKTERFSRTERSVLPNRRSSSCRRSRLCSSQNSVIIPTPPIAPLCPPPTTIPATMCGTSGLRRRFVYRQPGTSGLPHPPPPLVRIRISAHPPLVKCRIISSLPVIRAQSAGSLHSPMLLAVGRFGG
jgi:hypothetical protein